MSGLAPSSTLAPRSTLPPSSGGGGGGGDLLAAVTEKARVLITITATEGTLVSVTRTHPSGRVVPVRGMTLAPLSGGAFVGWDYEMPIGLEVSYQASVYIEPDTVNPLDTTDPVTLTWTTENDWLKDPLEPARNMPILINDMSEYAYDTPTGIHTVLGRPDPVTIGEVRRAATGTLTLITLAMDDRDRLHYITASGHVLLLQSSEQSGVQNMYLALTGVTETRLVNLRGQPEREWAIGYQEVSAPVGDAAPTVTWQDVADQYPTWQDVVDAGYGSWLEFIESINSTQVAPILNWRGA